MAKIFERLILQRIIEIEMITILNKEIRDFFVGVKIRNIKRAGLGVGADLWKAVKLQRI